MIEANSIFSLINKTVIITGASSGIGRQCAVLCSKNGANVVLVARDSSRLRETLEIMQPGKHVVLQQDLTNYHCLERLVGDAVNSVGKIDGLIHSAGIETVLPLKLLDHSHYEKAFAVNVISGFELTKSLVKKKYFSSEGGSLVFIASVAGMEGQAGKIAYTSSKAALINGVKSLALELATRKIRANCISPGICKTRMSDAFLNKIPEETKIELIKKHPLGLGEPSDIANSALFLLSNASRWITGTNMIVDGGFSA